MSKSVSVDKETVSIAATCWRLLYKTMNQYERNSDADSLILVTISLLDKADYGPTIMELVALTGLPKASVSRYVARGVRSGFLAEVIDPKDRRLRRLRQTAMGRNKGAWHEKQMLQTAHLCIEALRGNGKSKDPVSDLKNILLGLRESPSIHSECLTLGAVQRERTNPASNAGASRQRS